MLLNELLHRDDVPRVKITGVTSDSRNVDQGDLFLAVRGRSYDGFDFIDDAIEKGAAAICAERLVLDRKQVPCVVNCDLGSRIGHIAARFYGYPAQALSCTGITGTNGKSSIAHMAATIIPDSSCIGTLGWGVPPHLHETSLTTLDPVSLQRNLGAIRDNGSKRVFLEVSSHALDQGRADELKFDCAVFTNLTRDHLDYHRSMDAYARAKQRLFERVELNRAVINIDDDFGNALARLTRQRRIECLTYGTSAKADLRWFDVQYRADGVEGCWVTPWGEVPFELPFYGDGYLANATVVLALARLAGLDPLSIEKKMRQLESVPGRMDLRSFPSSPRVVVDYAHSPAALENALASLRKHIVSGKLICVFGCGGDRDKGKRSQMGAISEKYADVTVVTNDNPRSESPSQIVDNILSGVSNLDSFIIELNRSEAIQLALNEVDTDGLVLVAGKGNETYQEIETGRVPYSDLDTVDKLLGGTS